MPEWAPDLYESYVGSILSACALGVIAFNKIAEVDRVNAVIIPMVLAAVGVLASILGSLLVKTGENTDQSTLFESTETWYEYECDHYCGCGVSARVVYSWEKLYRILFRDPCRSACRCTDWILYRIFYVGILINRRRIWLINLRQVLRPSSLED